MSVIKNDNDRLPADVVDGRIKTYTTIMNVGYLIGLPISLALVMLITLLMIGQGLGMSIFIGILTGLGVYTFAKTFFVH